MTIIKVATPALPIYAKTGPAAWEIAWKAVPQMGFCVDMRPAAGTVVI